MKKRILSIVLALAIVLSFMPVVAFADTYVADDSNNVAIAGGTLNAVSDADQDASSKVMELIEKIPSELPAKISTFIQDTVKKARTAYDALSPLQKALVSAKALEILNKAEAEIEAIKAVKTVTVNSSTVNILTLAEAFLKAGASPLEVTKIVIGKKVTKISAYSFKFLTKVKTLDVKTKKLTKEAVKSSLKGSKVTTINVKVGTAATNKQYVAKYKKIFTKANAGKKVTVK